jgi:hypothetical protein
LDDRALTFRGIWSDALHEIENFQVWNRDSSDADD